MMFKFCRHCRNVVKLATARGLCTTCYRKESLRRRYPLLESWEAGYRRLGLGLGPEEGFKLPDRPTDTQPGSDEKIRVMRERAERGEAIFHPKDRQVRITAAGVERY